MPRITEFEKGQASHLTQFVSDDGYTPLLLQPDPLIMDDRYCAIRVKDRGVVILTACSHAGICNVARDVVETNGENVFAVVGGFHLVMDVEPVMEPSVELLKEILGDEAHVLPGHCTGWKAKCKLRELFGDRCQPTTVGGTYL